MPRSIGITAALAAACVAAAAATAPADGAAPFELPAPTGPHAIGLLTHAATDFAPNGFTARRRLLSRESGECARENERFPV